MRRITQGTRKAKGTMESLAFSHLQSLMHTQAFIEKGKLPEKWPAISVLPEAAGASSAKSRKKGPPSWALSRFTCRGQNQCVWNCRTDHLGGPASGNKHHPGSSLQSPRSASERW